MTLTPPVSYHRLERMRRSYRHLAYALTALLAALAICVVTVWPAAADDGSTSGNDESTATTEPGVLLSIDSATAVVTSTSGYHLKATVTNNTDATVAESVLTLLTNALYTFNSRTDIQQWSQGQVNIPTPNQLGFTRVPELDPGASATVSIDAGTDQEALQSIAVWGPKPLLLYYEAADGTQASLHTFLTRSNDGLSSANTPALNLTVAMPLTSSDWQMDQQAVTALLDNTDTSSADIVSLANNTLEQSQQRLVSQYPQLQIIADPLLLDRLDDASRPSVSGVMQPAGFDITAYAAQSDKSPYHDAGIDDDDWNAQTAQDLYRSTTGGSSADIAAYAWQGSCDWTMQSLTAARRQGYTTVITDHEFDENDNATVHTGNIVVSTDAGDITVLVQQRELGRLAQGKPTTGNAEAETTDAGRIARFMAQSAFYQMEQPYISRNLLICLNARNTSVNGALMGAIKQASWLNLNDLNELLQAEPYATGDDALQFIQDSDTLDDDDQASLTTTLTALSSARNDITRFTSNVLASKTAGAGTTGADRGSGDADDSSGSDADSSSDSGDANDAGNADNADALSDAQALARRDATETSRRSTDASGWTTALLDAERILALHALAGQTQVTERMVKAAGTLASDLMNTVTISPSEPITVVSESAKMPVTISNSSPYPVRVQVSSITDSMEIVTSRLNEVDVPAYSEVQVTFTIRVSTSGSTKATLTLQDRNGVAFGSSQTTAITSVLRISDMSGFVIIGLAVALALLGLWRQFHRRKDPDE